jgi:hypothetical protein
MFLSRRFLYALLAAFLAAEDSAPGGFITMREAEPESYTIVETACTYPEAGRAGAGKWNLW